MTASCEELRGVQGASALQIIDWCREQAGEIMSISAGCATTHGDPGGGLEWVNSIASDIAINMDMLADRLAQACEPGAEGMRPETTSSTPSSESTP